MQRPLAAIFRSQDVRARSFVENASVDRYCVLPPLHGTRLGSVNSMLISAFPAGMDVVLAKHSGPLPRKRVAPRWISFGGHRTRCLDECRSAGMFWPVLIAFCTRRTVLYCDWHACLGSRRPIVRASFLQSAAILFGFRPARAWPCGSLGWLPRSESQEDIKRSDEPAR